MAKYRKKQVVIEAVEWKGHGDAHNENEILLFTDYTAFIVTGRLTIQTLEGEVKAEPGDYIIKDVDNQFYPCKPHIFAATYEAVDG